MRFQGVYAYKGYTPSLKDVPISFLHTGDYKAEATFKSKDDVVYLKYAFFISIINL